MRTAEEILKANTGHAQGLMSPMVYKSMQEYADQFKPQWIDVKDRAPEKYSRVVIYKLDVAMICYGLAIFNGKDFLFDASLISNEKAFDLLSDKPIGGVTHWQPLPEPPTKD